MCVCVFMYIYIYIYIYICRHHHRHHVPEGLGVFPVPRSSYVPSSFCFIL